MYRTSLDTVSGDLTKAKAKFQRGALLGGGPGGAGGRPLDFDKSMDQRQRMMNTTDKLRGGTDTLNAAHASLEETISVGAWRGGWVGWVGLGGGGAPHGWAPGRGGALPLCANNNIHTPSRHPP